MLTLGGRKLGRPSGARAMLLRNLATSLFQHEKIVTTLPRAKELSRYAEKIITRAKGSEAVTAQREVAKLVLTKPAQKKLFEVIVPRYSDRNGGYTQIIRTGFRTGDAAPMALIRLIP
ncbi:MAG: 50S ribosomal protein L17 [Elusimicrobia bacterium RIFCSPLOWO2_01_FULL_60_11]|nr:MAG: 50S ribosomal protein L17 [Elusimicrobia bacterium RIFCSPLOWO2_01_FULL_60_11]